MLAKEIGDKTALVSRALNSDLRRELLKVAFDGPLDAEGFYNAVASRGFSIKYVESVYKELQNLVEAGLLDKYYDLKSKKIFYRLKASQIVIDVRTMQTEIMDQGAEARSES